MKPMLAAPSDGEQLMYPLMASAKLDGVRALIIDSVVMSRALKPIPNRHVQAVFGQSKLNGFDGELIVGPATAKDVYNKTTSGVMSRDGTPPVKFMVFDDFSAYGGYQKRFNNIYNRFNKLPDHIFNQCFIHQHVHIRDSDELFKYEHRYLLDGYEGIMLRDPSGPYKHGRSTLKEGYLLKIKRFVDSEAVILDISPLMHNTNEGVRNELGNLERSSKKDGKVALAQLGSMHVKDIISGIEFDIGTGFTGEQRVDFWSGRKDLIGKMIKYKSQPIGVKERPRFPVFLGFRHSIDM